MKKTETQHLVGLYLRISEDREGKEMGVDRQRGDCTARAQAKGWKIVDEYHDNDRSAGSVLKVRPDFERLLADVESGRIDAVIAYSETRIARNPEDGGRFVRIMRSAGAVVNLVTMGDIDIKSASGQFVFAVLNAAASNYSNYVSETQTRKQRELREAGKFGGGPRRYGYEPDGITPIDEEAEIIRGVAQRVLDGESRRSIARDLNARGIPSATGGQWSQTTLQQIITNHRIIGIRAHKGEPVMDANGDWVKAEWPAILTVDVWQRLRDIADQQRRGPKSTAGTSYPLSGLVYCGECGGRMYGDNPRIWKDNRVRQYTCPSHHAAITADVLEAEVKFWTDARAVTIQRMTVVDPETVAISTRDELLKVRQARDLFERMLADGEMKPDDYRRQTKALNDREAAVRASLPGTIDETVTGSADEMVERIEVRSAKALNDGKPSGRTKLPIEDRVKIVALPGVIVKPDAITTHPEPEEARCTIVATDGTACENPGPYVKTMCVFHYHRTKKYGDPRADIPRGAHVGRNAAAAFK